MAVKIHPSVDNGVNAWRISGWHATCKCASDPVTVTLASESHSTTLRRQQVLEAGRRAFSGSPSSGATALVTATARSSRSWTERGDPALCRSACGVHCTAASKTRTTLL